MPSSNESSLPVTSYALQYNLLFNMLFTSTQSFIPLLLMALNKSSKPNLTIIHFTKQCK